MKRNNLRWLKRLTLAAVAAMAICCGGEEPGETCDVEAAQARCKRCLDACGNCNDPLASCTASCRGCEE